MANRYFRNTGNTNWSVATNWSTTSGGTADAAVPTSADYVLMNSLSGACNIDVINPIIQQINLQSYDKTLTMNGTSVKISGGSLIWGSGFQVVSPGWIIMSSTTYSISSSGGKIPYLSIAPVSGIAAVTLGDAINIGQLWHDMSQGGTRVTWLGSFGWTCDDWLISGNTAKDNFLSSSQTYVVRYTFKCNSYSGSAHGNIKGTVAGTKARLYVSGESSVGYTDFIDVDASGGQTLYPFSSIVTTCTNITNMTDIIYPSNRTEPASVIIC